MKLGALSGVVVVTLIAAGGSAMFVPSAQSPLSRLFEGSGTALDCEDLLDGDRVRIRDETEGGRAEIRVEADTRVRPEARFESSEGSASRREARVELCGIVEFIDEDGDGRLGPADRIVRSDLVTFGMIGHAFAGSHRFLTRSAAGNMTVVVLTPDTLPPSDVPLITWIVVANPACDAEATHFAVTIELDTPANRDEFAASPCGDRLQISGTEDGALPS